MYRISSVIRLGTRYSLKNDLQMLNCLIRQFLVCTNDLPSRVSPSVRLLADDWLLYRVSRDEKDAESLQTDLNYLRKLETGREMVCNPDKCEHIRITKKRNVIETLYSFERNYKSQVSWIHHTE